MLCVAHVDLRLAFASGVALGDCRVLFDKILKRQGKLSAVVSSSAQANTMKVHGERCPGCAG